MATRQYVLLGPEGRSARVPLSDDAQVSTLLDVIADKLGLQRIWELVLRKDDTSRIDQESTLAAAGVRHDGEGRILVEVTQVPRVVVRARGRLGKLLGKPQTTSHTDRSTEMYRVMPCYLAIDTSSSMDEGAIDQINAEIPRMLDSMTMNGMLPEVCRLSIVTFDKVARLHTPLTDVSKMDFVPLAAEGAETDYRAVFELLRDVIGRDMYWLYLAGFRPQRPVVFFLSDGKHNIEGTDWSDAIVRLVSPRQFHAAPHVIAFGFGDATEANIRDVGRTKAYLPKDGRKLPDLQSFMSYMLNSMTMSATQSVADDDDPFRLPNKPPDGWLDLDDTQYGA